MQKEQETTPTSDIKLARLYKKAKTGAIVICDIQTQGPKITVTTGQLNGKKIEHDTICTPKNVGKTNETSADEQARLEALAKHAKKIKGGYVRDPSGEITRKLPMLVKKYQEQKKNVVFPCYASPKLNGINGLYRKNDKNLELYSRGGDLFPEIPHLRNELLAVMKAMGSKEINGELYIPGMHLQDIQSAVTKTNEDSPKLELHVFEICDTSDTYKEKLALFEEVRRVMQRSKVHMVPTIELNSHEEIEAYLKKCLDEGYEGIVVRNAECVYEHNVRSSNAFKYKLPKDGEFKIVSWRADKKGHPVFTCECGKNNEHQFAVKVKGTNERRLEIAQEADTWIGQWLKIEFESYSKDHKPTKPVGLGLRDCDAQGNPKV